MAYCGSCACGGIWLGCIGAGGCGGGGGGGGGWTADGYDPGGCGAGYVYGYCWAAAGEYEVGESVEVDARLGDVCVGSVRRLGSAAASGESLEGTGKRST